MWALYVQVLRDGPGTSSAERLARATPGGAGDSAWSGTEVPRIIERVDAGLPKYPSDSSSTRGATPAFDDAPGPRCSASFPDTGLRAAARRMGDRRTRNVRSRRSELARSDVRSRGSDPGPGCLGCGVERGRERGAASGVNNEVARTGQLSRPAGGAPHQPAGRAAGQCEPPRYSRQKRRQRAIWARSTPHPRQPGPGSEPRSQHPTDRASSDRRDRTFRVRRSPIRRAAARSPVSGNDAEQRGPGASSNAGSYACVDDESLGDIGESRAQLAQRRGIGS